MISWKDFENFWNLHFVEEQSKILETIQKLIFHPFSIGGMQKYLMTK